MFVCVFYVFLITSNLLTWPEYAFLIRKICQLYHYFILFFRENQIHYNLCSFSKKLSRYVPSKLLLLLKCIGMGGIDDGHSNLYLHHRFDTSQVLSELSTSQNLCKYNSKNDILYVIYVFYIFIVNSSEKRRTIGLFHFIPYARNPICTSQKSHVKPIAGQKRMEIKKQNRRLKSHFRFKCNWNKIFFFPGSVPSQPQYDAMRGGVQHGMNFKWLFILLFQTTAMRIHGSNTIIMRKRPIPCSWPRLLLFLNRAWNIIILLFTRVPDLFFVEKKHDSYHRCTATPYVTIHKK